MGRGADGVCRLGGRRGRDSRSRCREEAGRLVSRMSSRAAAARRRSRGRGRSRIAVCSRKRRRDIQAPGETGRTVSNNELFYVYIHNARPS